MGTKIDTSFTVRPDQLTTTNINSLKGEAGRIVFDTDLEVPKWYKNDSDEWIKIQDVKDFIGFANYEDTGTTATPITLTNNVWTDLTNNGLGGQTLKTFLPAGVTDFLDVSTGYFDFTELTDGSEAFTRTSFSVNPNLNNALLEFRITAGTGGGSFDFTTSLGRLDDGSGKYYPQVLERSFFMNGSNALDNPWKLQARLSTDGTLINLGSYISVIKK